MANGVQLATAYISLNVRTDDIKKQVSSALNGVGSQGREVGHSIGSKIAEGIRGHFGGGLAVSMFNPLELAGVRWAVKAGTLIGGTLKKAIMGAVGGLGLGAIFGAGGILTAGLDRLKTLQQSTVQLSLKLSPDEIKSLQKQISDVVTGTPIPLDKAMQAVPKAINAGLRGDAIKQYIKDIADLTASTGGQGQFDQLAVILEQVRSKGKLAGDEIQQLVDAGVDVRGILKDAFGWDDKKLQQNLAKGKVGINELQKAIQKSFGNTAQGGLAKEMGKTFDGAIGSLKASAARLGANFIAAVLGKQANEDPLKDYAAGLNKITDGLNSMGKWVDTHRGDIHQYFQDAKTIALSLVEALRKVGPVLSTISGALKEQPGLVAAIPGAFIGWKTISGVASLTKSLAAISTALKITMVADAATGVAGINAAFKGLAPVAIAAVLGWGANKLAGAIDGRTDMSWMDRFKEVIDWATGGGLPQANASTIPTNTGPQILPPDASVPPGFTRSFGTPSGGYNSRGQWVPSGQIDGSNQKITGSSMSAASLPDAHGAHQQIAAALSVAQGMGLQMSAGKNDHSADGGFHQYGLAGDFSNQKQFGPNTPEMTNFANQMLKLAPYISELIYSGVPFNIKDGKLVPTIDQPGSPYTTDQAGYHGDHVHLAVKDEFAKQFEEALGSAGLSMSGSGLSTGNADIGVSGPATITLSGPVDGLTAGAILGANQGGKGSPGGIPLTKRPDGTWTSSNPAWAHLINRESGGNPTIVQGIKDINSGGNEAEGLFQITPKTWEQYGGKELAASPKAATPEQQAEIAARIIRKNPSGSDWGAGLPGRENAQELLAGIASKASGGGISGPGSGTSDSIPAWLSNGEHVLTAKDVQAMGGQQGVYAFRNALHKAGGGAVGFAPGGAVDPSVIQDAQDNIADLNKQYEIAQTQFTEIMQKGDASQAEILSAQQRIAQTKRALDNAQADLPAIMAGQSPPDRSKQEAIYSLTDQLATAQQSLSDLQANGEAPASQMLQANYAVEQATRERNQAIAAAQQGQAGTDYGQEFVRSLGFIPAAAGETGVAGTSSLAGFINMGNSVVSGVIDTGVNLANQAVSAAIAAGAAGAGFGGGAAAAPIAQMAASYGIQLAGNEAKRISSYWFGLAGIGADATQEIFSPFGMPRWLGYDYGNFAPQLGIQQAALSTVEKMGGDAINKALGPGQKGINVPPEPKAPDSGANTAPSGPSAATSAPQEPLFGGGGDFPKPLTSSQIIDNNISQSTNPLDPRFGGGTGGGNGGGGSWARGGAVGVYDNGGILKPGQLAFNASRTPEGILTKQQWDAMMTTAASKPKDGAPLVQNLYAQDMQDAIRQLEKVKRRDMMQYAGRP